MQNLLNSSSDEGKKNSSSDSSDSDSSFDENEISQAKFEEYKKKALEMSDDDSGEEPEVEQKQENVRRGVTLMSK